jgi:hypothetical protein
MKYSWWNQSGLYFQIMMVLLALLPPLVYAYAKNLLDSVIKFKPQNKLEKKYIRSIYQYYFMLDQVVFFWVIYLLFGILWGLIGHYCSITSSIAADCFVARTRILLTIYMIIVSLLTSYSIFARERLRLWGRNEARIWSLFIGIYSLLFPFIVFSVNGLLTRTLYNNIDSSSLWILIGAILYYFFWWLASLIKSPMQKFIYLSKMKKPVEF